MSLTRTVLATRAAASHMATMTRHATAAARARQDAALAERRGDVTLAGNLRREADRLAALAGRAMARHSAAATPRPGRWPLPSSGPA
jgi:hypothetical protein